MTVPPEPTAEPDPITGPVRDWLRSHQQGVLITLKRDGSPQSSNVSFTFDGTRARISVTDGRAKTKNVRRDQRVVLHVLGDTFWQFAAISGTATAGPVSIEPGDAAGRELLEVYESMAGPHPDPQEYFQAMVDDRRLVITVVPVKVTAANIS